MYEIFKCFVTSLNMEQHEYLCDSMVRKKLHGIKLIKFKGALTLKSRVFAA